LQVLPCPRRASCTQADSSASGYRSMSRRGPDSLIRRVTLGVWALEDAEAPLRRPVPKDHCPRRRVPADEHGPLDAERENVGILHWPACPPSVPCGLAQTLSRRLSSTVQLQLPLRALRVADGAMQDAARVAAEVGRLQRPRHRSEDDVPLDQKRLDGTDPRRSVLTEGAEERDAGAEARQPALCNLRRRLLEIAPDRKAPTEWSPAASPEPWRRGVA